MDHPAGWLYTTAFNLLKRHWRVEQRPVGVMSAPCAQGLDRVVDRVVSERSLAELPNDQRLAIVVRHVLGLSVGEAAAVLGRSPEAVRALTHRGVTTLRSSRALSSED
jgi:DNA-directed RNA polymerase specialized sigma24 family protein